MSAVMFPLGIRLTSWVCVAAFAILAAKRREMSPIYAGFVWAMSFEAAFDITRIGLGRVPLLGNPHLYTIWGITGFLLFMWKGIRPSLRFTVATVLVWAAWLAIGFPFNLHTMVGFDPVAEAFNVTAKTLWALAYFVPLLAAGKPRTAPITGAGYHSPTLAPAARASTSDTTATVSRA